MGGTVRGETVGSWTISNRAALIGIILITTGIFILDSIAIKGVAVGMLYVIPIVFTIKLMDERATVTFAVIITILTLLSVLFKPTTIDGIEVVVPPNRTMITIAIWITTGLTVAQIRGVKNVRTMNEQLEESKKGLEKAVELRTADLTRTVGQLKVEIDARKAAEQELMRSKAGLELRVMERTAELSATNMRLTSEIQERERSREALHEEKERLAKTLASIGDAVIATDRSGVVTLMNRVAENLTGYTSQEAVGRPLEDVFNIINERTRERIMSPVEKVLLSGGIVGLANHTVLIAKDGTERAIGDSGAPVLDSEGRTIGVVLVFRDMTAELKNSLEMERMSRLDSLGVLAGGIAHDFNNILTALEGSITIAKIRSANNPDVFQWLSDAEQASFRAHHLTRQLLTFAKGGEPIKKVISIKSVIRDSSKFALSGSNVSLRLEVAGDLWPVDADPGQLGQVFQNIVINAKEAMGHGGVVEVKAENVNLRGTEDPGLRKGKFVKVTIRDDGMGIPEKYIGKIFDPYFTTKQGGRGLGLTIVHSIVNKHDGFINVESKAGIGSMFEIFIPAADGGIIDDAPSTDPVAHGNGKVLWIDDEEAILTVGSELLQILGYHPLTAVDGSVGTDLFREAIEDGLPFDVVIVDLTIPGKMGGEKILHELQKIDKGVKAIVCSGYADDPVMARFKEYGFVEWLSKPFTLAELGKKLSTVMEQKA